MANFFEKVPDLKLLTFGSKYLSLLNCDIALTKNENIFIKTPKMGDKKTKKFVDNVITYMVDEGFVPKAKHNKKVHVWVYN
jgi:hypothetical protein|tara:strand:- start:655 stop:897 length:243 start_codon:yes stop_codon:yes gene_type:complete